MARPNPEDVEKFRAGDDEVWTEILTWLGPRAAIYYRRQGRIFQIADEDFVQEVITRAWSGKENVRTNHLAWLRGLQENAWRDLLDNETRRKRLQDEIDFLYGPRISLNGRPDELPPHQRFCLSVAEWDEFQKSLEDEEERLVLLWRLQEDSIEEIKRKLGARSGVPVTRHSVEKVRNRVLAKLLRYLNGDP